MRTNPLDFKPTSSSRRDFFREEEKNPFWDVKSLTEDELRDTLKKMVYVIRLFSHRNVARKIHQTDLRK